MIGSTSLKIIIVKQLNPDLVAQASDLYQNLIDDTSIASHAIDKLWDYPVVAELMEQFNDLVSELKESPLFALWLQDIDMVDILHLNIFAERSGTWGLYPKSLKLMLPYMAATNRSNYTKVLRRLLDEYQSLPDAVKRQFEEGGWVVRTSTENIARCQHGDYTIETFLMDQFKGDEGLRRGRRLDVLTRLMWIKTRPMLGVVDQNYQNVSRVTP